MFLLLVVSTLFPPRRGLYISFTQASRLILFYFLFDGRLHPAQVLDEGLRLTGDTAQIGYPHLGSIISRYSHNE